MPVQIEIRLAAKANAIQIAATNQTFSSIKRLPQNTPNALCRSY
jgi:hypothetical protein